MLRNMTVRPTAVCSGARQSSARSLFLPTIHRSKEAASEREIPTKQQPAEAEERPKVKPIKKTQAQLDEELMAAMEGRAGDGGLAGAELEGGKAVSMKRGVRDNMFRYI